MSRMPIYEVIVDIQYDDINMTLDMEPVVCLYHIISRFVNCCQEALLIHDDSSLTLLSSLALQNPPLRAAQKQQQGRHTKHNPLSSLIEDRV